MRTEIFGALVFIVGAAVLVRSWDKSAEFSATPSGEKGSILAATPKSEPATASPYQPGWGREVRVPAGAHNQYYITAAVNHRPASFLVDTGASYVALRDSDARAAGIYTTWTDYTYPIRTANGETKAAMVTVKEIEIDGIRVNDVKAFILQDDQLGMNLLGMSFLSKLKSVEARGGELILKG